MTRISIGVLPSELCNQMLQNEVVRECPRLFFIRPCKHVPEYPTLNTGHVSYWRAWRRCIAFWWLDCLEECRWRGLTVNRDELMHWMWS